MFCAKAVVYNGLLFLLLEMCWPHTCASVQIEVTWPEVCREGGERCTPWPPQTMPDRSIPIHVPSVRLKRRAGVVRHSCPCLFVSGVAQLDNISLLFSNSFLKKRLMLLWCYQFIHVLLMCLCVLKKLTYFLQVIKINSNGLFTAVCLWLKFLALD